MKRILLLCLVILISFCLTSCNGKTNNPPNADDKKSDTIKPNTGDEEISHTDKPICKTWPTMKDCVISPEIAEKLITKHVDLNSYDVHPILFYAQNAKAMQILIDGGANAKATSVADMTPFYTVNDSDSIDVLIAAGADVHAKDSLGGTPLFEANSPEVIKRLIKAGLDVNTRDVNGRTAIFSAHNFDCFQELIRAGANAITKDNDGNTPLFTASDKQIAEALIKSGNKVNDTNKDGETALFHPVSKDVAEALITAGAEVNAKDKQGNTVLKYIKNHENINTDAEEKALIIQLLVEKGAID